jgi:hypothetical protein
MSTNLERFVLRLITNAKIYNTTKDNLLSANWTPHNGVYRQLITLPTGKTFDNSIMTFKDPTTKEQLFLKIEKASETAYYVYSNDNTLSATIFYTS